MGKNQSTGKLLKLIIELIPTWWKLMLDVTGQSYDRIIRKQKLTMAGEFYIFVLNTAKHFYVTIFHLILYTTTVTKFPQDW